ncbi:radical SAM protein, partial [Thermodesulfobacteriota bacterium]
METQNTMHKSFIPIAAVLKTWPKLFENRSYFKNVAMVAVEKYKRNLSLHPADGKADRIRQFSIRITDLCNLRCHTCGQWGDKGFLRDCSIGELRKDEVTTERYIELLRDLKEKGHTPSVYLWGGEPMLYKGSVEIIEEAARLGMAPSVATNGTGLVQHADRLVSAPMFVVQISVDGPDAEIHNACRPGANPSVNNFATISNAIERINQLRKEKGQRLPLIASLTTINNLNYNRLVDIYDVFKDKVDTCVFYLAWWIDEESARKHAEDFEARFGQKPEKHFGWIGTWTPPDYQVLSDQLNRIKDKAANRKGPAIIIMPNLTAPKELETYYTNHQARFGFERCSHVYTSAEINSNGDMSPCRDYHDFVVGNVKEKTVTELWNSEPYRKFRLSLSEKGLMPVCSR